MPYPFNYKVKTLAQFFSEGEGTEPVNAEERKLLALYRAQTEEKRKAIISLLERD